MAFYAVMKHDTREDTIHVFKCPTASDPNTITNWTSQDTYVFDGDVKSIWAFVQGSDIHIAVAGERQRNGDNFVFIKYLRFDPGTDAFDVDEEAVHSSSVLRSESLGASYNVAASVAVRSDGDVVVFFTGEGTNTFTVQYSRREAGSWTRDVEVNSSDGQIAGVALLGASDLIHFFWRSGDGNLRSRSLDSSNTLGTDTSIDTTVSSDNLGTIEAVSFNDGTARIRVACVDGNGQISTYYSNDSATPSYTAEANASDNDVAISNESPIAALVLDGQVSHLIYAESVSSDIFRDENDGIGGWGTDTEEQDAVTCNAISANVYDRSGTKLAYLWDSNGTTDYDEVSLVAAAVPDQFYPSYPSIHMDPMEAIPTGEEPSKKWG